MADWYSRAREADGRTDEEVIAEIRLRRDWTTDETGRSNSSPEFLRLVNRVAYLIRSEAHALIAGNTESVARLVVAQLAHVEHMGPPPTVEDDRLTAVILEAVRGIDPQVRRSMLENSGLIKAIFSEYIEPRR